MSPANPLSENNDEADAPAPASEPSRPTEPWRHPAPMRDSLAGADEDAFDVHDTIPAPPWLDDALETLETLETSLAPPR